MKLSKEALVEIMAILQYGILRGEDVSENLRQLDLIPSYTPDRQEEGPLVLSADYLANHPRGGSLQGSDQEN